MKIMSIAILMLTCSKSFAAHFVAASEFDIGGRSFEVEIVPAMLLSSKKWDPASEALGISRRTVEKSAHTHLLSVVGKHYANGLPQWVPVETALVYDKGTDRWYFRLAFLIIDSAGTGARESFYLYATIDGTIVPVKSKKDVKNHGRKLNKTK